MSSARKPSAGFGLAYLLTLVLLCVCGWRALHTSIRDEHPQATSLPDMRVDVNNATAEELSILPGLGPKLSQRIVDDREHNGPFQSVDDLKRVSGIGPAIVGRVRPYAVAEPPAKPNLSQ